MKKIIFSLVALVAAMSMNAQIMKVYKDGAVVASYTATQMDSVVYEMQSVPVQKSIYMSVENGDFSLSTDNKTLTATKDGITVTFTVTEGNGYFEDYGYEEYEFEEDRRSENNAMQVTASAISGKTIIKVHVLSEPNLTGTGPWKFIYNSSQGGWQLEGSSKWGRNVIAFLTVTYEE